MANIAKWMLDLIGNPKTAKFVETLKHSDLPKNWANDPEVIRLAEKAYQQGGTESPFFKAWFGNSKVVDDAGNPLEVFHGTNAYDIKKFKPGKAGLLGGGIYTTPNEKIALRYTDYPDTGIHSLYEKMENPFRVTDVDSAKAILGEIYGQKAERELAKRIDKQGNGAQIITKKDAQKIQDKGYDGIFWDVPAGKEYSTLDPTAIKSTKNRGTFNPDDPNIYRSLAPVGIGLGTLASAGFLPDTEASAKSAYINSPEMKAAMMGIRDEPVKDAWNPVEALATAPIGAFTTGARAASVGIDALLSALLGD